MQRVERSQRSKELGSVGNEATHDPPLSRLARLREAPASIRRVRSQGRGGGGAEGGEGERDNSADVFAVLQLARSARQRVLHFVPSPLSLAPSLSHPLLASSRLAAPAAVLLLADDFNVRSQRPLEHKSFYGNFIPNAPRSLARSGTSI